MLKRKILCGLILAVTDRTYHYVLFRLWQLSVLCEISKTIFNPFLTSGLVLPYHLDESISSFRGFCWKF